MGHTFAFQKIWEAFAPISPIQWMNELLFNSYTYGSPFKTLPKQPLKQKSISVTDSHHACICKEWYSRCCEIITFETGIEKTRRWVKISELHILTSVIYQSYTNYSAGEQMWGKKEGGRHALWEVITSLTPFRHRNMWAAVSTSMVIVHLCLLLNLHNQMHLECK